MSEVGSKTEVSTSTSNFDLDNIDDVHFQSKIRLFNTLDSIRVGLTLLALAAGITILGVSADALAVYDATHVSADFLLPLWPNDFDLRPTVALVVGSTIVIVASAVSLAASKMQHIRSRTAGLLHTCLSFTTPFIAFIAALIAMSFFYAVNASNSTDSLQSWSCRWRDVGMDVRPHFGTLCKQSKAGLALSVLLVPLEAVVLAVAAYQSVLERQLTPIITTTTTRGHQHQRKAASPALS